MAGKMDIDEKLKAISLGGCWFAENTNTGYDSYAEMREWEDGPYRYLCSRDVAIMDPSKYEFFNLNTKKGYLIPGEPGFRLPQRGPMIPSANAALRTRTVIPYARRITKLPSG